MMRRACQECRGTPRHCGRQWTPPKTQGCGAASTRRAPLTARYRPAASPPEAAASTPVLLSWDDVMHERSPTARDAAGNPTAGDAAGTPILRELLRMLPEKAWYLEARHVDALSAYERQLTGITPASDIARRLTVRMRCDTTGECAAISLRVNTAWHAWHITSISQRPGPFWR